MQLDRKYWRAVFDEQAEWVDTEPQIEYRFIYFSEDEDRDIACLGSIDEWWLNEDGFVEGKFFAFGKYPYQKIFGDAVAHIFQ